MYKRPDSALGRGVMELARLVDQDTTGIVEEASRLRACAGARLVAPGIRR